MLFSGLLAAGLVSPLLAVPDNPAALATVVTTCTQAGLQAALNSGGTITFNCGPNPVTIPLTSVLTTNGQATTLDGGDRVTLDGQQQTKILLAPYSPTAYTLTLQNLHLRGGRAPGSGGLAAESGAALTAGSPGARIHITAVTFTDNATTRVTGEDNQGGAIFVANAYELVIRDSTFRTNRAGSGGAIGIIAAGLLVEDSVFEDNQAVDTTAGGIVRGYGGAIHVDGVWNAYNPTTRNSIAIRDSRFVGNTAVRGGGALSSVVSDNAGTLMTIERSTFQDNLVSGRSGEYGQGGAIYHVEDDQAGGRNEDNLIIRDTTVVGNRALRQGGGIWLHILGRGQVVNTTVVSNTTTAPLNEVGQGGGMAVTLGVIAISNSTFAHNHAAYQAGALHAGGSGNADQVVTLSNTIFAHNTLNEQALPSPTRWQGYHTNRPLADGGQNIQHPRLKPTYNNDVNNAITAQPIYQDPLLQALGMHGGPTATAPLAAGSPARDTGNPAACPARDQRGYVRNGHCDIGAYEYGGTVFTPTSRLWAPLLQR